MLGGTSRYEVEDVAPWTGGFCGGVWIQDVKGSVWAEALNYCVLSASPGMNAGAMSGILIV